MSSPDAGIRPEIKFSLLLCAYGNDSPKHVKECLGSIGASSVLPNEIIFVKDGPLPAELDEAVESFGFHIPPAIIALPSNQTQGIARKIGTEAASHEWVALMDSDDVAAPDRFEKQLAEISLNPLISIHGGQIAEFSENPAIAHAVRSVPRTHGEIAAFAKTRNPFNAMTVMFKKSLALEAGNFRYFPGFEDYDLWARMLKRGAVCQNSPDVLVYARTGSGMYGRRRGMKYIRQEWKMQKELLDLGLITKRRYVANLMKRTPARLAPGLLTKLLYRVFARSGVG